MKKVDPKIEKFYADAGMHIFKMVYRKAKNQHENLTDGQIREAAVAFYWKKKGGVVCDRRQYAARVYALAQEVSGNAYEIDMGQAKTAADKIDALEGEKEGIRKKRKRDNTIWVAGAMVLALAFACWRIFL